MNLSTRPVPPRGWYVEIDHPSGHTLRPQILDDPQRNPQVNGYPTLRLPVPMDEAWQSESFDDADMRLWHDGDRQPIERLEHRRVHPDRVDLEGRGGVQLERRVIESIDVEPTHELVERLIEEYTDYDANVDEPLVDTEPATLLESAGADLELAVSQALLDEIENDEVPLEITSEGIRPLKTAHVIDLQDNVSDDVYSGGEAQARNQMAADAEFEYVLNADDVGIGIREGIIEEEGMEPTYDVNGEIILEDAEVPTQDEPSWFTFENLGNDIDDTDEVQLTISGEGDYVVDVVIIYDQRFHDSDDFDNEVHEPAGYLDLSEYPEDPVPVELAPLETPLAMTEVDVDVETDDTEGLAEIGIGIDGTDDYDVVEWDTSHSLEYEELSTTARVRFGLGARRDLEPQDETPRVGYEPQTLEATTVGAVLDATPVVTDRSFDDRLINVLRELADLGNFVFEVQSDGDGISIEWTQLDQREATVEVDPVNYSVDRQTEDVVERAIIYGGARTATRRTVEVSVGEWVDLPFEDVKLVDGQTDIYDGDTEYEEGSDYELLHTTEDGVPQIRALEDGDLSDDQEVSIDTRVKPRGEFARENGVEEDDLRTVVEDIPGLMTQQMCDQVALYLVDRTADPLREVELTLPHSPDWSVIDAIDTDRLPGSGPYQTRHVETTPEGTEIRLADRMPRDEILDTVRDRVSRNAERV